MNKILHVPNLNQPEFPRADLPAEAESWLAVALQSRPNFAILHKSSDDFNKLYNLTHMGLAQRSRQEFDEADHQRAFILGVMFFEAIGGLVRQTSYDVELVSRSWITGEDATVTLAEEAAESAYLQASETPRLAAVVMEVADSYLDGSRELVSYALGGSAIARAAQLTADELAAA